ALHSIPSVIGLAGHELKAEAVLAALRGRYIDTLVTDYETACTVLHMHQQSGQTDTQELGA
ncbi:MAG: sugar-binding domain-containing protein, partial [Spirochaetota bacterium]